VYQNLFHIYVKLVFWATHCSSSGA